MAQQSTLAADAITTGKSAAETADARVRSALSRNVASAYRLACVILGSPTEAEDAMQDALERAWRARSSLRDFDRFDAWFQRIVVNSCRDRVRRRRSRPEFVSIGDARDTAALAGVRAVDPFAATLAQDAVGRAFARLNVDQRVVVAMRFYLDLEINEIARRLGTRQGTVKSRLHRALKTLRDTWEGDR